MLNLTTNRTYRANLNGTNLGTTSIALAAKVNVVLLSLRARFASFPMQDVEDCWRQSDVHGLDSMIHRIPRSHGSIRRAARSTAAPSPARAARPAAAKPGRPSVVGKVKRSSVRRVAAFERPAA